MNVNVPLPGPPRRVTPEEIRERVADALARPHATLDERAEQLEEAHDVIVDALSAVDRG